MELEVFYPKITRNSDVDRPFIHFSTTALSISEAALKEMGIDTRKDVLKLHAQEVEHEAELAKAEAREPRKISANDISETFLLWAKPAGSNDIILIQKVIRGVGYKLQRAKANSFLNVGKEAIEKYELARMGKYELDKEVTIDGKTWFRFKKLSQVTLNGK